MSCRSRTAGGSSCSGFADAAHRNAEAGESFLPDVRKVNSIIVLTRSHAVIPRGATALDVRAVDIAEWVAKVALPWDGHGHNSGPNARLSLNIARDSARSSTSSRTGTEQQELRNTLYRRLTRPAQAHARARMFVYRVAVVVGWNIVRLCVAQLSPATDAGARRRSGDRA
jgi:hypothetical protein